MIALTASELQFLGELTVFASILNPTRKQLTASKALELNGLVVTLNGRIRVTPEGRSELDLHKVSRRSLDPS